MPRLAPVFVFLLQSVCVGLAAAFVIVLFRPDLLPTADSERPAAPGAPASYADAVELSAPSVANIYTRRRVPVASTDSGAARNPRLNTSLGSAVVIDSDGYLVTNYHVVADAAEIRVQMADGRIATPDIVGFDIETDLALLHVDLGPLPAIPLGRSSQLRIGDVVLAIGNPYGLTKTVTQGIVSATGRGSLQLTTFENFIQTDAAINEGNSGGALINSLGELVGINTAVLAQDAGTEGISFAIPVDLVRGVVDAIQRNGRVIRGWIGLDSTDLSVTEAQSLGLEPDVGIMVLRAHEGGPAAAAGLAPGDVILSINGEPIRSRQQALLLVTGLDPGDTLDMEAWRDGRVFRTRLTVIERPPSLPNE